MSERKPADGAQGDTAVEREIAQLIAGAGRRATLPGAELTAIAEAVRDEWEVVIAAQRQRRLRNRRLVPLALAASALLALALAWWWGERGPSRPAAPPEVVATIEMARQPLRNEEAGGQAGRAAGVGEGLRVGAVAETGGGATAGPAALRWGGGQSVRLAAGTRLRLLSAAGMALERGAVYVDAQGGGGALEVETAFARVREAGTQFEVRVEPGLALRVRVREGVVALVRDLGSSAVRAGEEVRLQRDGRMSRGRVEPDAAVWDWVLEAAPSLDIEGVLLSDYLSWLARETGWQVGYSEERLPGLVRGIRLHGTIEGLAPDDSLGLVLPGSGLGYRLEAGRLTITPGTSDEASPGASGPAAADAAELRTRR